MAENQKIRGLQSDSKAQSGIAPWWSGKKHQLKWGTRPGRFARNLIQALGLWMMRRARKLLHWSGGRCTWCGSDCGFDSVIGSKGLRCYSLLRNCTDRPAP